MDEQYNENPTGGAHDATGDIPYVTDAANTFPSPDDAELAEEPNPDLSHPEPPRQQSQGYPYSNPYYQAPNNYGQTGSVPQNGQALPNSGIGNYQQYAQSYPAPQTYVQPGQQTGQYYNPYQPEQTTPIKPPKKKNTGKVVFIIFLVIIIVLGIVLGIHYGIKTNAGGAIDTPRTTQSDETKDSSRLTTAAAQPLGDGQNSTALTSKQVYQKVKASNVAILVYNARATSQAAGEGSGVIIQEDSAKEYTYILTCAHVIQGAELVRVELENGTTYEAVIVGFDARTDVGLLKIKKTGLHGAAFGDSAKVEVGDTVYAIGNPGGTEFKGSFSNGMVSAIDRPLASTYKMVTIQHTAPINPGNSGGALLNAAGQVIGINSQKIVDTEYEGMGFAIPSSIVESVVNNLIAKGYVPNRPKLGIQYLAAANTQVGYFVIVSNDLPAGSVIIAKIDTDSVLSGTQVQANDIITQVNGKPLNTPDVLLDAVENGKVGDSLKLTIVRVTGSDRGYRYSTETFSVTVQLVEEKGTQEETTTAAPWYAGELPY